MKRLWKAKDLFSYCLGQTTDETIFLSQTIPVYIESLINHIKPKKAIGFNSIPRKILKEFKTELSELLSDTIKEHFQIF